MFSLVFVVRKHIANSHFHEHVYYHMFMEMCTLHYVFYSLAEN